MKCKCQKLSVRVTGWRDDSYYKSMELIETIDEGWRVVVACPNCGQHWLVDEYDKSQDLFAIKIDGPNDISDKKFLEIHKEYLLEAHGGKSGEQCKTAGCSQESVNGMAFCAECLIKNHGVFQ